MPETNVMEQIVSLCKRRGFIYPASEIYGGIRGFWDYGPLGVLLKNNLRDWWWRNMVECPPIGPDGHPVEIVGLDSAIIQHPMTWKASGHVESFNDPMIDDKETQQRFRADHLYALVVDTPLLHSTFTAPSPQNDLIDKGLVKDRDILATINALSVGESIEEIKSHPKKVPITALLRLSLKNIELVTTSATRAAVIAKFSDGSQQLCSVERLQVEAKPTWEGNFSVLQRHVAEVPSPYTGKMGTLTEPRAFSLMLDTYPGPIRDEENKAYLRPETAQGIFLDFKNIVDTTRVKIPFGVAQVGKSFRNEVTPRNYIFRSREFEQMEMEWFCHPDDAIKWYQFWRAERMKWWESLGVKKEHLRFRDHDPDELAFYSKATVDIEYLYPFTAPDFGELEGVAHRGDYDLTQHSKHSGQKLDYFDQELQLKLKAEGVNPDEIKARSRYIPNVIEPASGLTRAVLVLLCEAYRHEKGRQGTEEYLSFKPQFAPVKLGIFPLVNKDGMPEVAEKLYLDFRQSFTCEYDPKQSIGKRYARMDEIGTPFCITVDGQTLADQTVTVRQRDSMQQSRVSIEKLRAYLRDQLG